MPARSRAPVGNEPVGHPRALPLHGVLASATSDAPLQGGHGVGLHDGPGRLRLHHHHLPEDLALAPFVAGFTRVFTMQRPGSTNFPAFFTCCALTSPKLVSSFMHSDFFSSVCAAKASAKPPMVIPC